MLIAKSSGIIFEFPTVINSPKNKNTEDYTLDMAINLIKDKGKAPKAKRNVRNKK